MSLVALTFQSIFLLILFICQCSSKALPSFVPTCHRYDPEISQCFAKAFEALRPHIKNGMPQMKLPSLNPLVVSSTNLNLGGDLEMNFTDINIFHAEKFILQNAVIDVEKNHIELSLQFPKLRITSKYRFKGRLLFLQLDGSGAGDGNFTNVIVKLTFDGTRYKKGHQEYIRFNSLKLKDALDKPTLSFTGLFKDNPELNAQTNKLINENIEGILEELQPVVTHVIRSIVLGMVNNFFSTFSLSTLFPE